MSKSTEAVYFELAADILRRMPDKDYYPYNSIAKLPLLGRSIGEEIIFDVIEGGALLSAHGRTLGYAFPLQRDFKDTGYVLVVSGHGFVDGGTAYKSEPLLAANPG